jgi:DNA-binding SARP family transcriptional activator
MNRSKLSISMLGGLLLTRDGAIVSRIASRKAEALRICLACQLRSHPREALATLLWPDNEQARAPANLSAALTSLRKQLNVFLSAACRLTPALSAAGCKRMRRKWINATDHT